MQFKRNFVSFAVLGSGLISMRLLTTSVSTLPWPDRKQDNWLALLLSASFIVKPMLVRSLSVMSVFCGSMSVIGRGSVLVIMRRRSRSAKPSVMLKRGIAYGSVLLYVGPECRAKAALNPCSLARVLNV